MIRRGQRQRPPAGFDGGSSSSDDGNDAFAAMGSTSKNKNKNKNKNRKSGIIAGGVGNKIDGGKTKKRARLASFAGDDNSDNAGEGDDVKSVVDNGGDVEKGIDADEESVAFPPKDSTDSGVGGKRHHHASAARRSKMDALLAELTADNGSNNNNDNNNNIAPATPSSSLTASGADGSFGYYGGHHNPPQKLGSYVEPGQEHLTTNVFVGNLDPTTTEEELTDAFRQFGDLYSVKIMWPRTPEERNRNRNTGFVCFMSRADAQDSMDAYQDSDPLDTGRRMVLRWGKNVKKTVKFGTGGVPTNLRKKGPAPEETKEQTTEDNDRPSSRKDGPSDGGRGESTGGGHAGEINPPQPKENSETNGGSSASVRGGDDVALHLSTDKKPSTSEQGSSQKGKRALIPVGPVYDPSLHKKEAIIVRPPEDSRRLKFITTVASFVAKDGSVLEQKLLERESSNPDFRFLSPRRDAASGAGGVLGSVFATEDEDEDYCSKEHLAEHVFYRWRVYSFAHGDGISNWRTDPFVMLEPRGRFWVPPPLDAAEAKREEEAERRREGVILAAQEERRKLVGKKDFMTGRQLEHAKFGGLIQKNPEKGGRGVKLNEWEKETFSDLLRVKLCASRESICDAMAFAFDKSGAAREISALLKDAMLESGNGIGADTRIARLFLLSDVLFNSQQPGVRNAFQYRDAIEAMSPEVFESLGKHGGGRAGRMTMNKVRKAVNSVLSAWTNWSVYNTTFLDELQCHFEGKEIPLAKMDRDGDLDSTSPINHDHKDKEEGGRIVDDDDERRQAPKTSHSPNQEDLGAVVSNVPRGEWTTASEHALDDIEEDVDGEILDDVDGEALDDIDGEMMCEDVDGEALTDND